MLTGTYPFWGDTPLDVIHAVKHGPLPLERLRNLEISERTVSLITKMCSKAIDERFSSWEELLAEAQLCLNPPAPVAKPKAKKQATRAPRKAASQTKVNRARKVVKKRKKNQGFLVYIVLTMLITGGITYYFANKYVLNKGQGAGTGTTETNTSEDKGKTSSNGEDTDTVSVKDGNAPQPKPRESQQSQEDAEAKIFPDKPSKAERKELRREMRDNADGEPVKPRKKSERRREESKPKANNNVDLTATDPALNQPAKSEKRQKKTSQRLKLVKTDESQLQALAQENKLKDLQILQSTLVNIAPLKNLQSLNSLFFKETNVVDWSDLKGLKTVKTLTFINTDFDDLELLKDLSDLEILKVSKVANSAPLRTGFRGLKSLYLHRSSIDLQHLTRLGLKNLVLDQCELENLDSLKKFRNIKTLTLKRCKVNDIPLTKEQMQELKASVDFQIKF